MDANPETVKVSFLPLGRKRRLARDISLLEAAWQLGVGLSAVCGGRGIFGMLPAIPSLHFQQVGNVAWTGARMVLVSRAERERAAHIARHAEYVELTTHPHFQDRFTRGMSL
jgi:uncharacterized 2Fe-2S/4Fe-4S cluster protein (DUF4445 family)